MRTTENTWERDPKIQIREKRDDKYLRKNLEKENSKGASGQRFLIFLHHFRSMRRTTMIRRALSRCDLGEHITYPLYTPTTRRKHFSDL